MNMKIKSKFDNKVVVEFTTKEYEAFVELLKMKRKDYKGGK